MSSGLGLYHNAPFLRDVSLEHVPTLVHGMDCWGISITINPPGEPLQINIDVQPVKPSFNIDFGFRTIILNIECVIIITMDIWVKKYSYSCDIGMNSVYNRYNYNERRAEHVLYVNGWIFVCVTIIIDPCGESTGDLLQNRHISHCWLYLYIQIYPKICHYFTPKTRQKARYSRAGKCPFWDFENHLKKYLVEIIS